MDQGRSKLGRVTPGSSKLRAKRAESAAFRTFLALAASLKLSAQEAGAVLSCDELEFERLRKEVVSGGYLERPLAAPVRSALHQILSVRRTLRSLFVLPQHADIWLSSKITGDPFNKRTPVGVLREEGAHGTTKIACYLDQNIGDAERR